MKLIPIYDEILTEGKINDWLKQSKIKSKERTKWFKEKTRSFIRDQENHPEVDKR